MTVHNFIRSETFGADCVVDFGCGKGESITSVHPSVRRIVGLEIFEPYLLYFNSMSSRVTVRQADFRLFESFVSDDEMDCALMADSIEHVPEDDALDLLLRVQSRFRKCVVFTTLGYIPQGVGGDWHDANQHQEHLSGFAPEFFESLGFVVRSDSTYHGVKGGAIFAVWNAPGATIGPQYD
jgi:hypothetical protein